MKRVAGAIVLILLFVLAGTYFFSRREKKDEALQTEAARPPAEKETGTEESAGMPEKIKEAKRLLRRAKDLESQGRILDSIEVYEKIKMEYPESSQMKEVSSALGNLKMKLLFSPVITKKSFLYVVKSGDTLDGIARRFNTTVGLIMKSNGLRGDLIRIGDKLKVVTAGFFVVVDKSLNLLTLKMDEVVVKTYQVSTGPTTPVGTFKITSKQVNPVWKGIVLPGHPDNPLGSRWMGINSSEYGIHGTDKPGEVGKVVTKGCVRLTNSDVEELYLILPARTEVTIIE